MSFSPTDEQTAAVDLAATGQHIAIEALAGTGKTSTLRLIADNTHKMGTYIAFNKAVVVEAEAKFPTWVKCSTAHSLAYRAKGHKFRHRLNSPRMRSHEIARVLDIQDINVTTENGTRRLASGFLAGLVLRGVQTFCMTGDDEIAPRHIPKPRKKGTEPGDSDGPLDDVWEYVIDELAAPLQRAWADTRSVDGRLSFSHNAYLKLWQLDRPTIKTDFILYDESQDANGVMLSIVEQQRGHAQLIFVGDRFQSIYEWNGAVNAMEKAPVDARTHLTHSFRFGSEIAEQANRMLRALGSTAEIVGRGRAGVVGALDEPDIILARTNATCVGLALKDLDAGGRPHIVGGADDVVSFARAASDLMAGRATMHPELGCFDSWGAVREYVRSDELGGDLQLLVKLVDDFTAERIIAAFARQPAEQNATLVLSTAHKAKGREWAAVRLADDFPGEPGREEQRLLYVGVTRAELALDIDSVAFLSERHTTIETALDAEDVKP